MNNYEHGCGKRDVMDTQEQPAGGATHGNHSGRPCSAHRTVGGRSHIVAVPRRATSMRVMGRATKDARSAKGGHRELGVHVGSMRADARGAARGRAWTLQPQSGHLWSRDGGEGRARRPRVLRGTLGWQRQRPEPRL